jgi:hypothetical protein
MCIVSVQKSKKIDANIGGIKYYSITSAVAILIVIISLE